MDASLRALSWYRDDAVDWCRDRTWVWRLAVLVLVGYWATRHALDPAYQSVVDPLNFGVHELGHVVFSFLGRFPGVAGGTLLQCAAPIVGVVMFLRQRDYFAIAFAFAWLGTNLCDVAVYVGDARSQALPLASVGGGEALHDWGYLLGELGWLSADGLLAALARGAGLLAFAASLLLGGWLLLWMWALARIEA